MKKLFTLGAMLAATFSLTNCTEEIQAPVEPEKAPYTIQVNAVETKTLNDGFSTEWASEDEISVFHAEAGTSNFNGNSRFVLTNAEEGYFETSYLEGIPAESNDWYAIYPYNGSSDSPANSKIIIGSASSGLQYQLGNSSLSHIAGEHYPMWGVARNVSGETLPVISMTHLSSLVEVEVASSDDETVVNTVSMTVEEALVGAFSVDFTGETPSFTSDETVFNTATLNVTKGKPIASGETAKFYLAVKPFTAQAGSTLTLSVNGFEKKIELTEDVVFSPGKVKTVKYDMGSVFMLKAGTPKTRANEIEVKLTATGASKIYYAYLSSSDLRKYGDDAKKTEYLLASGKEIEGETAVAMASEVVKGLKAETEYTLIALAVNSEGKNSNLLSLKCKTDRIIYNDLSVSLEMVTNAPGCVIVSISASGAEDYLYWIGKTSDNTWKSVNYLGGTAARAEKYMYMNANNDIFKEVMDKYPIVDGQITMEDLELGVDYVIVATAKDQNGYYSHAGLLKFTPNAFDMGNIVFSTDPEWEDARPTVTFLPETFEASSGFLPGRYGFKVLVPAGFTAYVLAGSEGYFTNGDDNAIVSVEEKIAVIIENVDKPMFFETVVDSDLYGKMGYPYGHEFYQYEHGAPGKYGSGTIWASREYHDQHGDNGSPCHCMDQEYVEKTYQFSEPPATYRVYNAIAINDDEPEMFVQGGATGSKTEVVDRVYVVCKDLDGNCYQTFEFDVPCEYFANAKPQE